MNTLSDIAELSAKLSGQLLDDLHHQLKLGNIDESIRLQKINTSIDIRGLINSILSGSNLYCELKRSVADVERLTKYSEKLYKENQILRQQVHFLEHDIPHDIDY